MNTDASLATPRATKDATADGVFKALVATAGIFVLLALVGAAISMFMNQTPKERPLTHDLIGHLMAALGAKVDRVIINDLKSETYFARLIISAENELFEKKIIELDGRPSDCIALAIQQEAPIYVSRDVWDEVEDRSDVLRQLEENGQQGESEA